MERSKEKHTENSATINSTFFDTCTWSSRTHIDPSLNQSARCFHVNQTNRLIFYNHRRIPAEAGQRRYMTHDRSN